MIWFAIVASMMAVDDREMRVLPPNRGSYAMTTDPPLTLMIRKLETHAPLDAEDRAALLALPHTVRTFDASAYLVREGDRPDKYAVLLSGYAFRQKLTSDGLRQIISLHIPGDMLDLQHLHLEVADHNVQTLTSADVATIPRAAVQTLARTRPGVDHALFVAALVEASIFREWVLNIGRRDARSRLAHLLCEFAARLDAQGLTPGRDYDFPMTQEQIGDALGLTAVHINRTLRALEIEGLIVRNGRQVNSPSWTALRQVADFSVRYLHLGMQQA